MKMEERMLIKNLATTAEIINTINGGMAQPIIGLQKLEKEWNINVRIPSVNPDNLKIEIKDHELFLFQVFQEQVLGSIELPFLIAMIKVSNRVDLDNILAEYGEGNLSIHLPLDEKNNGYHREVDIIKR